MERKLNIERRTLSDEVKFLIEKALGRTLKKIIGKREEDQ